MPWQRYVWDVALEVDPRTDRLAYGMVIVLVQRQAGKTEAALPAGIRACLAGRQQRVWYTAQTGQDARDKWLEWLERVEYSRLGRLVRPRRTNGSESMRWPTGSTLRPFAPVPEALHGKQSDLVMPDEGWAFTMSQGAALETAIVPTQATRPGAQVWIISAAGTMADSRWLRAHVERGRAGDNPRAAYFEWSIPEGEDPQDIDTVARYHPAVGYTISRESLLDAQATMGSADNFARAYGNVWPKIGDGGIPAHIWAAAITRADLPATPPGIGVDVAEDRSAATIAACVGGIGEIIDRRPGVSWAAERVAELRRRHNVRYIVCPRSGPAGTVADQLIRAGVPLLPLTDRDYANACAAWYDALRERRARVRPHPDLDRAAVNVVRRSIGEGWGWGRKASGDAIDPLIAVNLAWHAEINVPQSRPRPEIISG